MSARKNWTNKQDETLRRIASENQSKNWSLIAKRMSRQFGLKKRTGKQCRERWFNHLDPDISKKTWTKADEQQLLSLHKVYGNRWTHIAQEMVGRSDNSIKNYFYSTVRRNLRRMGKYCGTKNSTDLMREIKPSTMTRIFGTLIESNDNLNRHLQNQGLTKDFLKESCENIRDEIIKFSAFKPKRNDKISQQEKRKYDEVFWLIRRVNQIYEKVRNEEKSSQTLKQLFRHYYQQMNRQSSEDEVQEQSYNDYDMQECEHDETDKRGEVGLQSQQLRSSEKVEVISFYRPLHAQSINLIKSYNEKIENRPRESNPQSSNRALEQTLSNIVEYAQEIEFNDPQFSIELGQYRQKSQCNNLELYMSNMSFKSPGFGTPLSQVNFFNSPKNNKISCLHDYLMRMSNSNKEELCLGSEGDVKELERDSSKRQL